MVTQESGDCSSCHRVFPLSGGKPIPHHDGWADGRPYTCPGSNRLALDRKKTPLEKVFLKFMVSHPNVAFTCPNQGALEEVVEELSVANGWIMTAPQTRSAVCAVCANPLIVVQIERTEG